ncbi:hypothetical protein KJY73_21155 [Bowmanella sp. Y26]|uniref:DUF350 domain-containing protein n=1 Tax=Bowmanella yangjiangensis TaxID=2811230 RepID=A0ABS3CXP7_9ALTE|nr:hypothetical protein [Bowmanella yangjiangensis]MBN7821892.1 hypothetical protein [Bowmanella yangjiangensis]MBT1066097.1 hypothetical protein [Bowmanella yangjiangensis]
MSNWTEAVLFGLALMAFVLGFSSIIMAMIHKPVLVDDVMKEKVEYGFFGVTGLVLCILFSYAI